MTSPVRHVWLSSMLKWYARCAMENTLSPRMTKSTNSSHTKHCRAQKALKWACMASITIKVAITTADREFTQLYHDSSYINYPSMSAHSYYESASHKFISINGWSKRLCYKESFYNLPTGNGGPATSPARSLKVSSFLTLLANNKNNRKGHFSHEFPVFPTIPVVNLARKEMKQRSSREGEVIKKWANDAKVAPLVFDLSRYFVKTLIRIIALRFAIRAYA